jgi:hypothetical protein
MLGVGILLVLLVVQEPVIVKTKILILESAAMVAYGVRV